MAYAEAERRTHSNFDGCSHASAPNAGSHHQYSNIPCDGGVLFQYEVTPISKAVQWVALAEKSRGSDSQNFLC